MISPRTNTVRDEVLMQRFPEATWDRPLRVRWLDRERGAIVLYACPFCLYHKGLTRAGAAPLSDTSWLVWRHLYEVHSVPEVAVKPT